MKQFNYIISAIVTLFFLNALQLFGNDYPKSAAEKEKIIQINLKNLKKYQGIDSFNQIMNCYENLQSLYIDNAEFVKAYHYCKLALAINDRHNKNHTGKTFFHLGTLYSNWGKYDSAILYYTKGLEVAKAKNEKLLQADILNNIGYLHRLWQNYDLALNAYKATLEIDQELKDTALIASDLNNIAYAYRFKKDYKNAILYYNKSLAVSTPKNYVYEMGLASSGLGTVYLENNDYQKAEVMLRKALKCFIESGYKDYLPGAYIKLGLILIRQNIVDSGYFYAEKGYKLAVSSNDAENRLEALNTFSEYYTIKGDYKTAGIFQERFKKLKDSLFNIEKHKQLAEFQVKYDVSGIQQKSQNMAFQKKMLMAALIALFILTSASIYILYGSYKRNKKLVLFLSAQKKQIENRLKELESARTNVKQENFNTWNLPEEVISSVFNQVNSFLEDSKIYLNDELTITLLSQKSDIPAHHISKAVNSVTNSNFSDFINTLRIKEAKQRLVGSDFQNFTIEAIGRSVGFKSRTSFIAAFKKFENITPSDYKKSFEIQKAIN